MSRAADPELTLPGCVSCQQKPKFPFSLVSPAVPSTQTGSFEMEMDERQLGCAEPSFGREDFVLPVSGIKSLLIYPAAAPAWVIPALLIGDSDTRWQQWPLDPALGEDAGKRFSASQLFRGQLPLVLSFSSIGSHTGHQNEIAPRIYMM